MAYQRAKRDPRTKEEVLDRMLSFDFDGDIRNTGAEQARLTRTAANKLLLHFPTTGTTYELEIHRPRVASEERSFAAKPGVDYVPPEEDHKPATRKARSTATPGATPRQAVG